MILILLSLIFLNTSPMILFDFNSQTNMQQWTIVNDGVMGGLSKGTITLGKDGHAVFSGKVLLENNGGFSSVRHRLPKTDVSTHQKIVLRVKGDGKTYQFRVKTNSADFYSYSYNFKTTEDWTTIEIPFSEMVPTFRGRTLNRPNYPGNQVEEITFLIGNGKEEVFALMIDKIEVQ
jgi:NADH dehydrogenase [ubiquinone] 1 alpha subcomplex assembly factor 1